MKTALAIIGIFAGVALIAGLWIMGSYNGLVTKAESVDASWSQVETQYQRRFDLVPNLVAATKGFLQQEQAVFGAIAEARTKYAGSAPGTNERVQATAQYESALARLMVIVENYPQLRSAETVRGLMDELSGTENRVLVARDRYNEQVRDYNVMIKRFPRNVIAGMFGYEVRAFFESDEDAKDAPKVDLTI
jgi:LemA protein